MSYTKTVWQNIKHQQTYIDPMDVSQKFYEKQNQRKYNPSKPLTQKVIFSSIQVRQLSLLIMCKVILEIGKDGKHSAKNQMCICCYVNCYHCTTNTCLTHTTSRWLAHLLNMPFACLLMYMSKFFASYVFIKYDKYMQINVNNKSELKMG